MLTKIKLDLFKLKPKEDLIGVYEFFKKKSEKWFSKSFKPKDKYFFISDCPLCFNTDSQEVYKVLFFKQKIKLQLYLKLFLFKRIFSTFS